MKVLAMDVFRHASLLFVCGNCEGRGGGGERGEGETMFPPGKVQWLARWFVRHARLRRHVNTRPVAVSPLLSRLRESQVDFIVAMKRF